MAVASRVGISAAVAAAVAVVLIAARRASAPEVFPPAAPYPDELVWPMTTSERGLQLIRNFEGLRLTAYQDAGRLAIGYGHRGADVQPGQTITRDQAEILLRGDVSEAEVAIREEVGVPLAQEQFDALVSFIYNVGVGNFRSSTLLERLNLGDYAGAANEFSRWVYSGGNQVAGLIARRQQEAALFRVGTV